jgi:DNA modification methylase
MDESADILQGDALTLLRDMPADSIRCCVTSPPYWGLRDYGHAGQLGLERTPEEYVARMVEVFREVRRVLADDGTLWLNLGDSYAAQGGSREYGSSDGANGRGPAVAGLRSPAPGLKPKDLVGIPWRMAFALQADGWWLRSDIIWSKPNPMPESVTDRPTKAHEYLFLLAKSARYYYDAAAIAEPVECDRMRGPSLHPDAASTNGNGGLSRRPIGGTRNRRSVWTITPKPFKGAHFAVMPEALVEPCVLAGSAPGDVVLDPFAGSGTVGVVSLRHGRRFIGLELNQEYVKLALNRISAVQKRD